jgi:hypothetical protein
MKGDKELAIKNYAKSLEMNPEMGLYGVLKRILMNVI